MHAWITTGRSAVVKPGPFEQFEIELPVGLGEWSDDLRRLVEHAYNAGVADGRRQGSHEKLLAIKSALEL